MTTSTSLTPDFGHALLIIHRFFCPEPLHEVGVPGGSDSDHLGSFETGELDGESADPARGAQDHDALAALHTGVLDRLPGSKRADGNTAAASKLRPSGLGKRSTAEATAYSA